MQQSGIKALQVTVIERIQVLSKEFGGIKKFAEKCGLNVNSLRTSINRNSDIKSEVVTKIIDALPNLNLRWLLLGEGAMWLTEYNREEGDLSGQQVQDREIKYITRLNDLLEKRVNELERKLKDVDPNEARDMGIE